MVIDSYYFHNQEHMKSNTKFAFSLEL